MARRICYNQTGQRMNRYALQPARLQAIRAYQANSLPATWKLVHKLSLSLSSSCRPRTTTSLTSSQEASGRSPQACLQVAHFNKWHTKVLSSQVEEIWLWIYSRFLYSNLSYLKSSKLYAEESIFNNQTVSSFNMKPSNTPMPIVPCLRLSLFQDSTGVIVFAPTPPSCRACRQCSAPAPDTCTPSARASLQRTEG